MEPEGSLPHSEVPVWKFLNKIRFYGEELFAHRQTPKLDDHPLSTDRDCLFNIFAATLPYWRPFFEQHPENAPYCGDRDLLITAWNRGRTINNIRVTEHL
jgi:hypothetical protein